MAIVTHIVRKPIGIRLDKNNLKFIQWHQWWHHHWWYHRAVCTNSGGRLWVQPPKRLQSRPRLLSRSWRCPPILGFKIKLAGFRPNSGIIGKFRKLKKFYGHFVERQNWRLLTNLSVFSLFAVKSPTWDCLSKNCSDFIFFIHFPIRFLSNCEHRQFGVWWIFYVCWWRYDL